MREERERGEREGREWTKPGRDTGDMRTETETGGMRRKEEAGLLPKMIKVEVALLPETDTEVLQELEDMLRIIIEVTEIFKEKKYVSKNNEKGLFRKIRKCC